MKLVRDGIPQFEDLPEDEAKELLYKHHCEKYSVEFWNAGKGEWCVIDNPQWMRNVHYRVGPTPDYIDWSHVNSIYTHMARDRYGVAKLFRVRPSLIDGAWEQNYKTERVAAFASYKAGNKPWDKSLVVRPS